MKDSFKVRATSGLLGLSSIVLVGVAACGGSGNSTPRDEDLGSGGFSASGGAFSSGGQASPSGGASSAGSGGSLLGGASSGGSASGGSSAGGTGGSEPDPVLDAAIVIDSETTFQTIDGFGAALPMWVGSANGMLTTDELHKFVGLGDGELGLSILRTIIEPDSNKWAYAVANLKEAKSYGSGVQILATPWSPPANMKDNNSTTGGGHLKTDFYDDYANHLNSYVQYMKGQGVTIDVVSVQNEPDWPTDYESCLWSGANFLTFAKNNANAIVGPKIMIAESLQYTRSYTDPTLNDATAVNNIDLIGGHLYGAESAGKFSAYPLAESKGKHLWMTEWLIHDADGTGAAIWGGENQAVWDETLDQVVRMVHKAMTINWSAYIWWWGRRYYSFVGDGDANFGTTKGQVLKRGYAFSQFAKFVRPGAKRVAVSAEVALNGLEITAYENATESVVVILNRGNSSFSDVVVESSSKVASARAYATTRTDNRASVEATPTGRYATLGAIAPRSITTLVMAH